jgi:NitT/TauT family transport system ATP-binding protein
MAPFDGNAGDDDAMSATRSLAAVADVGPSRPKLSLRGVAKSFVSARGDRIEAVRDVTFDVAPGEFVCLIGPSGCGKSTVLNLVAGLERPDTGDVLIDDHWVAEPGPDRAVLFQEPALFPWMSVLGNVEFGLRLVGVAPDERADRAMAWLRTVHLSRFAHAQPHELSGGMRQRAALARALASQPDVLLGDEPFGSLDAQSREVLQQELQNVWSETRNTFLFVTHNVREAAFLADRVIVMSARPGRLLAEYRIAVPRPRRFDDVLLANVAADVHDNLAKEVERGVEDEATARPDLA